MDQRPKCKNKTIKWLEENVTNLDLINKLTTGESDDVSDQDYSEDLTNGDVPTPTMILYENGNIVDVYFGINGTEKVVIAEFVSDFYYHEGTFEKDILRD